VVFDNFKRGWRTRGRKVVKRPLCLEGNYIRVNIPHHKSGKDATGLVLGTYYRSFFTQERSTFDVF